MLCECCNAPVPIPPATTIHVPSDPSRRHMLCIYMLHQTCCIQEMHSARYVICWGCKYGNGTHQEVHTGSRARPAEVIPHTNQFDASPSYHNTRIALNYFLRNQFISIHFRDISSIYSTRCCAQSFIWLTDQKMTVKIPPAAAN